MTRLAPDPLLERVARDPGALALRARSATWTRAELLRAADGLAAALLAEGVGEGSRVAGLLDDDAPAVALIHACRRLGALHVPLNRRGGTAELQAQLRAIEADALLLDAANAAKGKDTAPDGVAVHRIEALLAGAPCGSPPLLRREIALETPATVVFTSGTTGPAKGAVLSHDNHRASAHAWAGLLRPRPGDRWLACVPLFHVAGLAIVTRTTRWGAELDLLHRFEPSRVSTGLDEGVTHLSLVPTQLNALLAERAGGPVPSTLRAVLLGGGPIPLDLLRRAREAGYPVLTTYGMTETGSGVASGGADEATLADPLTARALPGVQLRAVPDGAADGGGEILVRGEMVFAGYLDDPAATAAALPGDGWLHTGDIGSIDDEGLLRILDRRDDLIISGGENISPAEVEAVLVEHPAVVEAAVVGVPDERWGAVPLAYVVPVSDIVPDGEGLERHCRARLAAYKVPVRFVPLAVLPRNAMGKVLREELPAGAGAGTGASGRGRGDRLVMPYRTRTGHGPPLLLLHATLSSSRQLQGLATRLAADHTVISVDRRGSGRSTFDGPARPIDVSIHVADLTAILEEEGTGPAVVVGHSYGGCLALELAARRPELVGAVFVYEPPYAPVAPADVLAGIVEVGRRALAAAERGDLPGAALTFMEGVSGADAVAALRPAARERVGRAGQGVVADATLSGMDPHRLRDIACPARIATGSVSRLLYADIADALAASIPDGGHVRLEGLDHMAPVLRPDAVAGAIEEFLGS